MGNMCSIFNYPFTKLPFTKSQEAILAPKGAQLLSPGRKAWELKANATFRSAEGRRAARSAERRGKISAAEATLKIGRSAKRRATWKDQPPWSALSLRFQVPQRPL
jgi:hypothetical protein